MVSLPFRFLLVVAFSTAVCCSSPVAWCQEDFPTLTIPGLKDGDKPASDSPPAFSESRPAGDQPLSAPAPRMQQRLKPGEREFLPRTDPPSDSMSSDRSADTDRTSDENRRSLPDREFSARSPIVSAPPATGDVAVTIRSSLLNRFVEDQKIESDNVATRVLEADVRGVQTTATFVQLQSADNARMARLNVIAQGTVNSNTVGYTPQARITTAGNHTFNVIKPVYFDGRRFLTKPAYGGLQVRQTPQQVSTRASGMPLIGPLGDQMAWNEVLRRMPQSDAIVVRRVADDVFPRVNQSVDQQLTDFNRKWTGMRQRLAALTGSDRVAWSASSTKDSFTTIVTNRSVLSRTHSPDSELQAELAPMEAAAILVSEDGINHTLDHQALNGLVITDSALQQLVTNHKNGDRNPAHLLETLQSLRDSTAEPVLFSLRLADSQPLGVRFRDGRLQLQFRFQILPKSGNASVTQLMTVQLKGRGTDSGGWALFVSDISVAAASTNEQPDNWTNLINGQVERVIDLIPETELPRQIDLTKFADQLPSVRIHRIQSLGGQLRVSFKATEAAPTEITSRKPQQTTGRGGR
ncbi:MAG: hypothetical protein NXI04_10535 [Planctomycetaceae bacterium]|nr:hypothetical protein [Planctomycetaceae bacterium]